MGLNLNHDGGLSAILELTLHAQYILASGAKKTRFGNDPQDYSGSVFWHRFACYAALVVRDDWELRDDEVFVGGQRLLDSPDTLAQTLESVAFLEMVKCSPDWPESEPTNNMQHLCPQRYLKHELGILKPKWLLLLGKSGLEHLPLASPEKMAESEDKFAALYRSRGSEGVTTIVTVVHPTYRRGGSSESIVASLARLLLGLRAEEQAHGDACDSGTR